MARKRKDEEVGDSGRKYFAWNDELDKILVKNMTTLVNDKKMDSKGKFLPGAYKELERLMEVYKPGCGVKADPNIISRCKTLKAKFLAVHELRGLSGASWDDTVKMVDIEHTVYNDYVEKHPHCAKLNRVPFPCYDALAFVFGKALANGKRAVELKELNHGSPPIEVPKTLLLGWVNSDQGNAQTETNKKQNEEQGTEQTESPTPDEEHMSVTPPEKGTQSEATSRPKKMRCSNDEGGSEIAELKPMIEKTVTYLQSMLGESNTVHKQRSMLYEEVGKIEGLTQDQVMDATISLGKDDGMLQIFFSMDSEHVRKRFIERLLHPKNQVIL
ncbi:hypothetical protein LINPERHAP2_LOCUS10599 [Linum perenne]